jgi:flagellar M-ring protein FliF
VIEGGRVKRISVAVLVDGNYSRDAKGGLVYQKRSKEELDRIAALVRSAIGFDQKRGDQVEVVNLRFAETPGLVMPEPTGLLAYLQFTKEDILRMIELGIMLILGLVVLLFVVRPLVRRIITPEQMAALANALPGAQASVPAGAAAAAVAAGEQQAIQQESETSKMIEIAQVQGSLHSQSIQKVGELADRNPHETVSIIRQWLHETP